MVLPLAFDKSQVSNGDDGDLTIDSDYEVKEPETDAHLKYRRLPCWRSIISPNEGMSLRRPTKVLKTSTAAGVSRSRGGDEEESLLPSPFHDPFIGCPQIERAELWTEKE